MTRDEDLEWNHSFGVFEHERPRDPAWLNEVSAVARRGEYERAECCYDQVRFLVEVPRSRLSAGKIHEMPSVRMRLCRHHAAIFLENDPEATSFEIGRVNE